MHVRSLSRRTSVGLAAIVLLLFSPVVTFAEMPSDNTQADSTTITQPEAPQGPDAKTYHLNPDTGLWENDHYTWNPVTHETKPKAPSVYTYNPTTKTWDTTDWHFDEAAGKYVPQTISVVQKPTNAPTVGGPEQQSSPVPSASTPSPSAISNASHTTTNDQSNKDATATTTVTNNINSNATSGNATVDHNTTAGDATSGGASSSATVLNLLQSSWNLQGANPTTFTADINGDVTGDLLINPSNYTSNLPTNQAAAPAKINVSNTDTINNNINLEATSGNATVADNTTTGNATSGNATAIANVVNLINSMITAGQSFVGTININGNLDGDILLPQDLHEQLMASNVPTTTINTAALDNGGSLTQFTNNQSINNNVDLSATSGNANVTNNTTAGNGTSGSASTNLTVFNLTGRDVVGSNAMLVFVNVMGTWVGMIMDAPAGATAAMIGGGITTNSSALATQVSGTTSQQINNHITATAHTGDASVTGNTTAGNATSGDAKAGANISNITGSQMSLADWFGVLFINVLGNWHGSFGVDTSAGTPIGTGTVGGQTPAVEGVQVFQFVPAADGSNKIAPVSSSTFRGTGVSSTSAIDEGSNNQNQPQVLGVTTDKNTPSGPTHQSAGKHFTFTLLLAVISIAAALLLLDQILLRLAAIRRRRYMAQSAA